MTLKAREIAERSGLPMALAREVAEGKCSLNDALYRLMRREKAERLVAQHGLERAAAFNVAAGHISLETALLQKGLNECEARQPDRSVLVDLRTSGQPGCFFLFGEAAVQARVTAVDTYDVVLAPEGETGERRLPKHELRFVSPELSVEEVEKVTSRDAPVGEQGLGPSTSYRDRFRSSKKVLYRHFRDRVPTRVTLRDGTVLTGFVGWFGKWEFELALVDPSKKKPSKAKPVGAVVIFRHALHTLQAIS